MDKRLHVTPEKCIGCRTCELACAMSHPEDSSGMGFPRVAVRDCGESVFIPVLCLQCEDAACVKACPVEALVRNAKTGAIEVLQERCVRCMACVAACPFGNMHSDAATGRVFKCDLCGGSPRCAQFCPTRTLEYARRPSAAPAPAPAAR